MTFGARGYGLSDSVTTGVLGFPNATVSTFPQNDAIKTKHPVSGISADGNILLMRQVNGERLELTERLQ